MSEDDLWEEDTESVTSYLSIPTAHGITRYESFLVAVEKDL